MDNMQVFPKSNGVAAPRVTSEVAAWINSAGMAWAFLVLALGFTAFVRFRLLAIPLERDEGEFAYLGQLMLKGIPPYVHAYTMKLPGTHAAYALTMGILGQTVDAVHIGLMVVNAATAILLFSLVRGIFGNLAGSGAGITFALLSLTPPVLGTSAHATHFVLLPALAGLLLIARARYPLPPGILVLSGILLGVGVLMKQPGLFFVALALTMVICDDRWSLRGRIRNGLVLAFSAIVPYAGTCTALWVWGAFDRFWFWTARYGWAYSSILPLSQGRQLLYSQFAVAARSGIWLWCLAAAGLIVLPLCSKHMRDRRFALAFLIFSFLAVCPGFYFRRHYWILFLPAVAMFAGVALGHGVQLASRLTHRGFVSALLLGIFFAACAATIHTHFSFFFQVTPAEACRALYGGNPFPEAPEIGRYIQDHTARADTVAVIGSEPEIYFYSGRLSATGYIYTYGMMENQPYAPMMQREMAQEIETSKPRYLVFTNIQTSWLASAGSDPYIFHWFEAYRSSHYRTVRVMSLPGAPKDALPNATQTAATSHVIPSPCYLEILERTGP